MIVGYKKLKYFLIFWKEFGLDLFLRLMPSFAKPKGFAFIVHPRSYEDVLRNNFFFRSVSRDFGLRILQRLWPVTVSEIEGLRSVETGKEIPGWIIAVPLPAHQMFEKRDLARKRIIQAVNLAKKRGAWIVGLGALTASFTAGGKDIRVRDVTLTAGRSFTTHIVVEYFLDVVKNFGLDLRKIKVAIVGAAGGIGSNVARLLVQKEVENLILIDLERKISGVEAIKDFFRNDFLNIEVTHRLSAVKDAHFIITTTNAPEAVIHSDDVMPGTVIIDDAQPSDIGGDVLERDDVLVIEAGVINTKGIKYNFNFHLSSAEDSYSCLGEVMSLASLDGGFTGRGLIEKGIAVTLNQMVGVSPTALKAISENSKRLGFTISRYQYGGKMIPEETIKNVKRLIHQRF